LEKLGEIHQIEKARVMDSLQYWRKMMALVLAAKSMEGIKKLRKTQSKKSGQKCLQKSRKWKTSQLKI
jgi:predicted secreted protein